VFSIPFGVGTHVANEGRPYRFVTENFEAIKARIPPMFMTFMPYSASGCSPERAEDARKFFSDPKRAAPGMEKELAKMSEAVKDCAGLRAREGTSVAAFLKSL
jgi:hypothetical protein